MALVLPLQFLVVLLAGWLNRQQQEVIDYLMAENGVLRELHGRRRLRLTDGQRLRLARAGKALGRARLVEVAAIATPDTILRWFRTLAAQKYVALARRRPVRRVRLADLVVRIATENPRFGYTRIRDALANLGRRVGRSSVARILAECGIEPAPERRRRTSWREFLAAHWDGLFGADFFTVEVLVALHVFTSAISSGHAHEDRLGGASPAAQPRPTPSKSTITSERLMIASDRTVEGEGHEDVVVVSRDRRRGGHRATRSEGAGTIRFRQRFRMRHVLVRREVGMPHVRQRADLGERQEVPRASPTKEHTN